MSNPYQNSNGIFENKLGIQNVEKLKFFEYDLTKQKMLRIFNNEVSFNIRGYGLEQQQAIHKYLFEDIYEWAGKIRTIPYSKSMGFNGLTTIFADPTQIKSEWEGLEKQIKDFVQEKDLSFEQKLDKLTDFFIHANHLHPFPEGNGRSLQVFMKQISEEQGVNLDYGKVKSSDEWDIASGISSLHGEVFTGNDGRKYLDPKKPNKEPIKAIFQSIANPVLIQDQFVKNLGLFL